MKKLNFGLVIFSIVLILILFLIFFNQKKVDYICPDGKVVDTPSKCNITINNEPKQVDKNVNNSTKENDVSQIREANEFCYLDKCFSQDYQEYFKSNPRLYNLIIKSVGNINYLIDDTNEIETSGRIKLETPTMPSDSTCLVLTDDQKTKINSAKIAHSIWLDKNDMVQWKLNDYSDEEINMIFNEEELGTCSFNSGVVDYSPSEAYEYAKQFLKNNALDTSYAIINDLRKDFRHAIGEQEQKPNFKTLKEDLTFYVNDWGGEYRISRQGCHSMSEITIALLKSVNIPGYRELGWYDGDAHSSAFFPSIQKILIHGDDIYDTSLDNVSTENLLMSYGYFDTNVRPCGKFTTCAKTQTINYKSKIITSS